jgi:hypothetical protein
VSRHLKNELPVPALMQKTAGVRSPDRETAQHERTGAETQILPVGLTIFAPSGWLRPVVASFWRLRGSGTSAEADRQRD